MLRMQVEVTWVTSENLLFSEDKFYQMSQVPSWIFGEKSNL